MKYTKTIFIFSSLMVFMFMSCNSTDIQNSDETKVTSEEETEEPTIQFESESELDPEPEPKPGYNFFIQRPEIDSIYNLTHKKEDFANHFMNMHMSPIYYRTGKILNKSDIVTIMMNQKTDSTCMIELFKFDKRNWQRGGKVEFPYEQFMVNEFKVVIDDYNFDGMKDIFVRTLITNGTGFEYGHLFIVSKDDLSIKEYVFEERLGSIKTNPKTKELVGKKLYWCGDTYDTASASSQKHYFKWKNDQFVLTRVEDPCSKNEKEETLND